MRMIIPWAPGGSADVQLRNLADLASRALGQAVAAMMLAFGMTPVLNGFAGHVPDAVRRVHPEANISAASDWGGVGCNFSCVALLEPSDALFPALGAALNARVLALFGGGHVGQALVQLLADLPFHVRWIDSRDEVFPPDTPAHVSCEHSDPVQGAVPSLPAGSRVLIMSFSHAEDLDVVAACLTRQRKQADLPFIGLIGSQTKWATFRHRLQERGFGAQELAQVSCPIGVPGIVGKQPEVIAVAVAAQILLTLPV
jgi:xanthine/CO dehydrogenase XdhC/CoxF family maturation factor